MNKMIVFVVRNRHHIAFGLRKIADLIDSTHKPTKRR